MIDTLDPPVPAGPIEALITLMAELEPALRPEAILEALKQSAARGDGRHRIAETVARRPELLTGQGAHTELPGVLRFIRALVQAGAHAVLEPPCPRCGRQRPLGAPIEGLRVCTGCIKQARALTCGRCGKLRPPARRNDNGQPICQNCWHRDPRSWKTCAGCGHHRRVAALNSSGPLCQTCRPRVELICSICDLTGPCGISRATGKPVCERCRKRWIVCSRCGTGATIKGGTLQKPLCAPCVNPHPAFWKRCGTCQNTWQLTTAECTRCCLDRKLREILASADRAKSHRLDRLREALIRVDHPDHVLDWLTRAGVRETLQAVAFQQHTITHETVDALPPSTTLVHIRSIWSPQACSNPATNVSPVSNSGPAGR